MAYWRDSEVFGIKYHMMKTPDGHNYFSGDPVSSGAAAAAEVCLSASVAANHQSVLWAIWNRGIAPLETQIIGRFKQAPAIERDTEKMFGGDILNFKTFGVLLIATIFESATVDPNVGVPQRSYHSTHIEMCSFSYENAKKVYEGRDKLLPAKKNLKINFYHIWAVRS